jgi:uncharacterized membrane protein YoaK (UPF0700 family)
MTIHFGHSVDEHAPEHVSSSSLQEMLEEHLLLFTMILCCTVLASTEMNKQEPAGPVEGRKDYDSFVFISSLLCFASGIVNALAFMHMHMTVSHQSGNTTHTGRLLGNDGFKYGRILLAFGGGGFVGGFFKCDGESIYNGRYSACLMSTALATLFGCCICYCKAFFEPEHSDTSDALVIWAFGQGIQNAITRKCTSVPICTTHFTGYWTDFGLGLGYYFRARSREETPPNMMRTFLFGAGIFSFLLGGAAAAQLYPIYGPQAGLISAVIVALVALGFVPIVSGSKAK